MNEKKSGWEEKYGIACCGAGCYEEEAEVLEKRLVEEVIKRVEKKESWIYF